MLRGYRGIIAAVGLVLASPTYGQERKGDQPQAKGNSPSQFDHIAAPIEKLPKTEAPDRGCQPGQDDRYSDLCAQWKAADAATESASWTFWTFIASLVGLSIGGGTLVAAWLAARWAKKAADHTEAGATAVTAVTTARRPIATRRNRSTQRG